jgi:putative two-component system response regulator
MTALALKANHRILVVADALSDDLFLNCVLDADGYRIQLANDCGEALRQVALHSPDLIILDLDLKRENVKQVCDRLKSDPATRLIPILTMSSQTASEARVRAWELGAGDVLTKPFSPYELLARCRSLIRVKRLTDELDSAEAVVFALARVVEAKSPYTRGHAERVADYALALAAAVELPEGQWDTLRKGALLHDIGKIGIPDAILDKPGPLTLDEFNVVKLHTVRGASMVEPLRSIRDVVPMIRWHHERLDGAGYPDGLHDVEIPLLVRILSVADVYDSLSSNRPYRRPIGLDASLTILRTHAVSGGLDAGLVECFCRLMRAGFTRCAASTAADASVRTRVQEPHHLFRDGPIHRLSPSLRRDAHLNAGATAGLAER